VLQEAGRPALSRRHVNATSPLKVVEKSGLARSTVTSHLKHMEGDGLVEKEERVQGSVGRPKMLYKASTKLLEMIKTKSD